MSGVIKHEEEKRFKLWQPQNMGGAEELEALLPEDEGVEFAGGLQHLQRKKPAKASAAAKPKAQTQSREREQKDKQKSKGVWEIFDSAQEAVMEFLFPSHCPLCDSYVEKRGAWCVPCLQRTLHVRRLTIATELRPLLPEAWGCCYYHGVAGNLIRKLKYEKDLSAQPPLSGLLSNAALPEPLQQRLKTPGLFAVPVPLFAEKEKERGFNQTETIFEPWLRQREIPWGRAVLRTRRTLPQFGLDVAARRRNLRQAFRVPEEWRRVLQGRTVLLLDDIMTSGSTLAECAGVLREAGAADVFALVLASGRKPDLKLERRRRGGAL